MELIHSLLLQAIAGESAAESRYRKFAGKALDEGFPGIASLFTALAQAEAIHIANHHQALKKSDFSGTLPQPEKINSPETTLANLKRAIEDERDEFKEMYPLFHRQISKKHDSNFVAKIALLSIKWAGESEAQHYELLQEALQAAVSGSDVVGGEYYLCTVCGNIEFSMEQPKKMCGVCGHDISFYTRIQVEK
ncbi:MAG: ferritin family protein [Desulfocapsaceae bacterium]|nr:ferritin family protein [Desulfocapsaceae bacterium]